LIRVPFHPNGASLQPARLLLTLWGSPAPECSVPEEELGLVRAQPPSPRSPDDLPDGHLSANGSVRWTLPDITPRPEQVAYVRRQTRLVLQLWRLGDLTWLVEVLVSELAANVVRHARTPFTVTFAWDGLTLMVEVSDASPLPPQPPVAAHPEDEAGRGLLLVDAIAADWSVELHRQGKTVWFTLRRDSLDLW
jgi:anti-sigma regulatory factor (Ser/Thr protein kinase)